MQRTELSKNLEMEIDHVIEEVIDGLVRKAQEFQANIKAPKQNDCLDDGASVSHMATMLGLDPLTIYDATTLEALAFIVARQRGVEETSIIALVLQEFDVLKICDIQRRDFIRAQKYLVDLLSNSKAN